MPLMSCRHRPAVLAACAFLFVPVIMAGPVRSDEPSKTVPPSTPPVTATPDSGPRIAVEPPSFDFGRTLPQKAVTREFSIRNFGDRDLVIENVSTSALVDRLGRLSDSRLREICAAAFNVQPCLVFTEAVALDELDRRVAPTVQDQGPFPAQQARCVCPQLQLICTARGVFVVPERLHLDGDWLMAQL